MRDALKLGEAIVGTVYSIVNASAKSVSCGILSSVAAKEGGEKLFWDPRILRAKTQRHGMEDA